MTLVNQPSKMPTRKLAAVMIATALVQGGIAGLEALILFISPDATVHIPAENAIATLVPLIAGYFTRERV